MQIPKISSTNYKYNFKGLFSKTNINKLIDNDRLITSFVDMVKIDTVSDPIIALEKTPSTPGQNFFAHWLKSILIKLGAEDVKIDEYSFLTAKIPAKKSLAKEKIGLFAHMDTKENGRNIIPQVYNYKDGDIIFDNGVEIPSRILNPYKNNDIITSNGRTILGADDKAGIAEIIETLEILKKNPEIKHPELKITFTPDEECYHHTAIRKINLDNLDIDAGYAIDGNFPNIIDAEVCSDKSKQTLTEKLLAYASYGIEKSQIKPETVYRRGWSDASGLAKRGIPMANLGTGGHCAHTRYEFAVIKEMKKSVENIINILTTWAEKG